MNGKFDAELMAWITGELDATKAASLERRLEENAELALRLEELSTQWNELELSPPSPLPPGFSARVVGRVRLLKEAPSELEWRQAPTWVRASAAFALTAGVLLGVGVTSRLPSSIPAGVVAVEAAESLEDWSVSEPGLAELYAEAIEQATYLDIGESGS